MKRIAGVIVILCAFAAGCATNPDGSREYKRTGIGALAGAALGAGTGALFGGNKGSHAAIGAGAGALVGGAIGNYMDRQAVALKKNLPEAQVERQGEKIYVTLPSGILFDKNKDLLKPAFMESLARAASSLRESQTDIIIQGHTDSSGSDAINLPLSQRRADRVRDYLVAQGVPTSRLIAIGYGATRPQFPNDSEANRLLNRRVQLEISPNSALKAEGTAQRQ
uniref:OmpA/MotB domain protein n=1 Tax=Geobacter sp. (strain M21) TaxID=443144 RepID=C6DZ81_GEOSM